MPQEIRAKREKGVSVANPDQLGLEGLNNKDKSMRSAGSLLGQNALGRQILEILSFALKKKMNAWVLCLSIMPSSVVL